MNKFKKIKWKSRIRQIEKSIEKNYVTILNLKKEKKMLENKISDKPYIEELNDAIEQDGE